MPGFVFGGGGVGGAVMPPVLFGGVVGPLLPRVPDPYDTNTPEGAARQEVVDQLNGRGNNTAAETKGIEKAIEKGLKLGRIQGTLVDVLFGDDKAGAPDPAPRYDLRFVDEQGRVTTWDEQGNLVEVVMPPMWMADP